MGTSISTSNGSNVSYIPHEKQVDTKMILSSINSLKDTITNLYNSDKDNNCNVICLTNSKGEHSEVTYPSDYDIYDVLEKVIGLIVSTGWSQESVESAICEKAYMLRMDGDEVGSETNQLDFLSEKMKIVKSLEPEGDNHDSVQAKSQSARTN
jgi:hypothetical protein